MNQYQQALENHPFTLADAQVTEKVRKIIDEKFAENK